MTFDFRTEMHSLWENNNWISDSDLVQYTEEIIKPHRNDLPRLFRYMPANYNTIRGLETKSLYLSEIGSMNDIFEGLTCPIDDKVIAELEHLSNMAYLKSFTENDTSLLMWSMYADNYAGMCVEYDLRNMNDDYLSHLFPVLYSNKRHTNSAINSLRYLPDFLIQMHRDLEDGNSPPDLDDAKDIMALFLTKSTEWKHELEWRMVVTCLQLEFNEEWEDEDEIKSLYKIDNQLVPFPYAKSVTLGPKMNSRVIDHIADICHNKLKIPVYRAEISKTDYALEKTLVAGCSLK